MWKCASFVFKCMLCCQCSPGRLSITHCQWSIEATYQCGWFVSFVQHNQWCQKLKLVSIGAAAIKFLKWSSASLQIHLHPQLWKLLQMIQQVHCTESYMPFELFVNEIMSLECTGTKCNICERSGSILSLLRWTMLLDEASACQLQTCHSIGNDYLVTIARVVRSRIKHILASCNSLKDTAIASCRPASCDDG